MTLKTYASPGLCPLCRQTNQCAMANQSNNSLDKPLSCWCMDMEVRDLPAASNSGACYCKACLSQLQPLSPGIKTDSENDRK